MLQEIEAAVNFLTRLVAKSVDPGGPRSAASKGDSHSGKSLTEDKIQEFSRRLTTILQSRFRNHWFPERPTRGQGYRCIRINENCSVDTSIAKACHECGISYDSLRLPVELTLWIDPNEVTCRYSLRILFRAQGKLSTNFTCPSLLLQIWRAQRLLLHRG